MSGRHFNPVYPPNSSLFYFGVNSTYHFTQPGEYTVRVSKTMDQSQGGVNQTFTTHATSTTHLWCQQAGLQQVPQASTPNSNNNSVNGSENKTDRHLIDMDSTIPMGAVSPLKK